MTKNNYVNTRICLTYRTILLPKIESGPGAANLEPTYCPTTADIVNLDQQPGLSREARVLKNLHVCTCKSFIVKGLFTKC